MDGETPANPDNPTASRGQILVLDGTRAGTLEGIDRQAYDGTPLPVGPDDLQRAEITTRDIDRGELPALPAQGDHRGARRFRKTLRGKLVDGPGGPTVVARRRRAARSRPRRAPRRRDPPGAGHRSGHGGGRRHEPGRRPRPRPPRATSASRRCPPPSCPASGCAPTCPTRSSSPSASPAPPPTPTAPSTSSGPAGPGSIAIVNRRQSDLTDKADGVLYTSDGRDVEMSVASTKAFYAQIAAGFLLAWAIAERGRRSRSSPTLVDALRDLPAQLEATVARRPQIAAAAQQLAPSQPLLGHRRQRHQPHRRRGAADQALRALLQVDRLRRHRGQEAHRPVVRAADPRVRRRARRLDRRRRGQGGGDLPGPQGGADRDRHRGRGALRRGPPGRSRVPAAHPQLAFVLSAMVGHLFGYEAALAIDAQARPLREARAAIEDEVGGVRRPRRRGPPANRSAARSPRPPSASSTACAPGATTATSRPARPCGWRRCSATPSASPRSTPTRPSTAHRHAGGRGRRPHRRAHPRHRGAHPPGRRHQAPGQDRHRRHLPHRRDAAAAGAGAGRARGRRRPRPAHLPDAAHAGRPRPRRRRGHRLHPLRDRGRPGRRRGARRRRRPRRHRPRHPDAHRPSRRPAGHQAPRRPRAAGVRHPRPATTGARS